MFWSDGKKWLQKWGEGQVERWKELEEWKDMKAWEGRTIDGTHGTPERKSSDWLVKVDKQLHHNTSHWDELLKDWRRGEMMGKKEGQGNKITSMLVHYQDGVWVDLW